MVSRSYSRSYSGSYSGSYKYWGIGWMILLNDRILEKTTVFDMINMENVIIITKMTLIM